ncbi:MAG: hypothetical protein ABIA04_09865 [Pseudomonadota bacterium]
MLSWKLIREKYPNQFLLLKNYKEDRLDDRHFRILEAEVELASSDLKSLYKEYKKRKAKKLVFFNTKDEDLIIEEIPFMTVINNGN